MLDITKSVKDYRQSHVNPDLMPQGYVYRNIAGVYVFDDPEEADANLVNGMERVLQTAHPGEGIILSTGASYIPVYDIMADRRTKLAWLLKRLVLINQDELAGVEKNDPRAYCRYMRERLFANFPELGEENWIIPDSSLRPEQALDLYLLQLRNVQTVRLAMLGIGPDADSDKGLLASPHVAFIRPGTALDVLAQIVDLDETTRHVNSNGRPENYPARAISHGPADLVRAKDIFLFAKGQRKQQNIARVALGALDLNVTATVVYAVKREEAQENNLTFFLDKEAAETTLDILGNL